MNAIQPPIVPTADRIAVRNPATGETVGTVPCVSAEEITVAVTKARAAQSRWAKTPLSERMKIVRRFQQLVCDEKDSIAAVITREAGKPLAEALSTEILVVLDAAQFLVNHVPEFLRPDLLPHPTPPIPLNLASLS